MSDNLKRYFAIHNGLKHLWPEASSGNMARHLRTLAHLVCGIVGSKKTNLPAISSKSPDPSNRESRVKRYSRWLANGRIDPKTYYLPFARALLDSMPAGPQVLVMDGSAVGRNCQALVLRTYSRIDLYSAFVHDFDLLFVGRFES